MATRKENSNHNGNSTTYITNYVEVLRNRSDHELEVELAEISLDLLFIEAQMRECHPDELDSSFKEIGTKKISQLQLKKEKIELEILRRKQNQ